MTTATPKPKPWRRNRPGPERADVAVAGERPLLELTFYDNGSMFLTRRGGLAWRRYPVSPDAVAQVLTQAPASSGLLPPGTLAAGRANGTPFLVLYIAPQPRTLRTAQRDYHLTTPPLVWAGCGDDYRLWALPVESHPASAVLPLMHAPFPNVYGDGRICWGDSDPRPPAGPVSMLRVLDLFLEGSYFNLHLAQHKSMRHPASVLAQWEAVAALPELGAYPAGDLVPAPATLGWLIGGGPW